MESRPPPNAASSATPAPAAAQPDRPPDLSRAAIPDHVEYEKRLRKLVAEAERKYGRYGERRG